MAALIVVFVVAVLVGVSNWLAGVEHPGTAGRAIPEPRPNGMVLLGGPNADYERLELLRRASLYLKPATALTSRQDNDDGLGIKSCWFVHDTPSGTTPKFECVLEDGERVKVKYGREPEIHAEVAATSLLRLLGYAADEVTMVPRLRCHGCPRYPFAGSYVLANAVTRRLVSRPPEDAGYTDFEWISVERRFPAPAIETASTQGWHWWELADISRTAPPDRRADIDALRLLAAFLAHWDNKSENQRLVCLDGSPSSSGGRGRGRADGSSNCRRPLVLIQDLGATFGPTKVNLARWRDLPVWHERATCTVSMRALPHEGASYPDAVISEAGRAQLAARFAKVSDRDVRALFAYARFPQFQSATDDEKDLDEWVAAFRIRVNQIADTRCP
jgi:hypothetical protein